MSATFQLLKDWGSAFNDWAVGLAALAGGAWALGKFIRERAGEPALVITTAVEQAPLEDGLMFVVVTISLKNVGKVMIAAKPKADQDGYVFDDGSDRLRFPCTLELRPVAQAASAPLLIRWYEQGQARPVSDGIDVLEEYRDNRSDNQVDFWMEPGESYHIGVPLKLSLGAYLAKVTFVGAKNPDDYWSRQFGFAVAAPR